MYSVYIHQNKINKKIYVGVSTQIKYRWSDQKCAAFNENHSDYNAPFYRSIRKHGWDNFTHIILESFEDKLEALDAERFWIEYYRSNIKIFGPNYGYNQSQGGEDIANKSWEFRRSLSKGMSGDKNPMFGVKRSDKDRKKISDTKKANPLSKEKREKLSALYTITFSEEQTRNICSDIRSQCEIAKAYGVSRTVIKRILTESNIFDSPHKKIFKKVSKEELTNLLKKELTTTEIANSLNVSPITLYRKIKLLLGVDTVTAARELIKNEKPSIDSDN